MIETDSKKLKDAEFMREHTLTPEQTKKLIQDKLARAQAYSQAWKKREELILKFR